VEPTHYACVFIAEGLTRLGEGRHVGWGRGARVKNLEIALPSLGTHGRSGKTAGRRDGHESWPMIAIKREKVLREVAVFREKMRTLPL